jgi:hypothetical protein
VERDSPTALHANHSDMLNTSLSMSTARRGAWQLGSKFSSDDGFWTPSRGCDSEISWPIECLSKDLSSLGPVPTTRKNSGFGAMGVT